jgi:hypothetical protein
MKNLKKLMEITKNIKNHSLKMKRNPEMGIQEGRKIVIYSIFERNTI